jgi:hypothetical protein
MLRSALLKTARNRCGWFDLRLGLQGLNRRPQDSCSVHLGDGRPAALEGCGPVFAPDGMHHPFCVRNGSVGVLKDGSEDWRSAFRAFGSISLVQGLGHRMHFVETLLAGFVQIVPTAFIYGLKGVKDALQQEFRTVE